MISLIATVLNEGTNITDWLDGIFSQSILPDEIIIVDGGSVDGTWELLEAKAKQRGILKIFQHKGNISAGRNFAITKATYENIVVTDAGCTYETEWFKKISEPLLAGKGVFIATGFGPWFKKDDTLFAYLVASATTPAPFEFQRNWLPSSRSVAFKKQIWESVGGYPEWIPLCEDVVFDFKIFKTGIKPEYVREPLVFWRPRSTWSAYFKQLFGYTRSDGHGKLWLRRQITRYVYYSLNIALVWLSVTVSPWFALVIILGIADYLRRFWKRWGVFAQQLPWYKKSIGFVLLVPVVMYGDIAKMCGWPVGVYERLSGKVTFVP
jgi:glycosyltransferase involved in cell wall biosynthesis